MRAALDIVDRVRQEANQCLDPERNAALGQFMTPAPVAKFMAGLFTGRGQNVRLLDAGAGVGSLTAAFVDRWGADRISATAYEMDRILLAHLYDTLASFKKATFQSEVISSDFIEDAVNKLQFRDGPRFTHAILNPPYKKIGTDSQHRALLRAVGIETVNLYTAFVALALALMENGGEIVAIIPRSFCNGLYYKPFRELILQNSAIEHLHLFHSRTSAFNDDAVLQENIIIKLVSGARQGAITVTTSSDKSFSDLESHEYRFDEIVHAGDEQKFIHIPISPTHGGQGGVPLASRTLEDIGMLLIGEEVRRKQRTISRGQPERLEWSDESARDIVSAERNSSVD